MGVEDGGQGRCDARSRGTEPSASRHVAVHHIFGVAQRGRHERERCRDQDRPARGDPRAAGRGRRPPAAGRRRRPKARDERGGGIADIGALKDALGEVKGIGPATLDQLGDVLKVGRRAVKPADEKPAEAAPPAAQAGEREGGPAAGEPAEAAASVAKVARRTTEETAAAPVVEAGAEVAAAGTKVARRMAEETAAPVVEAGVEEGSRAVERTAGRAADKTA